MKSFTFTLNSEPVTIEVESDRPLLWVLRDALDLKGTKYGCGIGQCGACTVHVEGKAVRSCLINVSAITNKTITTIEGVSSDTLTPIQEAWLKFHVPQCGYCQSGQIMSALALLGRQSKLTSNEVDQAMQGNLCRCGTYPRIKDAILSVAQAEKS